MATIWYAECLSLSTAFLSPPVTGSDARNTCRQATGPERACCNRGWGQSQRFTPGCVLFSFSLISPFVVSIFSGISSIDVGESRILAGGSGIWVQIRLKNNRVFLQIASAIRGSYFSMTRKYSEIALSGFPPNSLPFVVA